MGKAAGRVYLKAPSPDDRLELMSLARRSRKLHRPWVYAPDTPKKFAAYLARSRREDCRCFLVRSRSDDVIAGVINMSQIFRGNFQNAFLGYYGSLALGGQGYMTEGMRLVLRHAFRTMKLHRLEANVQPGNRASLRLLRRCGFRKEGFSRRYLKVGGRWRDHERWAITAEIWKMSRKSRVAAGRGRLTLGRRGL